MKENSTKLSALRKKSIIAIAGTLMILLSVFSGINSFTKVDNYVNDQFGTLCIEGEVYEENYYQYKPNRETYNDINLVVTEFEHLKNDNRIKTLKYGLRKTLFFESMNDISSISVIGSDYPVFMQADNKQIRMVPSMLTEREDPEGAKANRLFTDEEIENGDFVCWIPMGYFPQEVDRFGYYRLSLPGEKIKIYDYFYRNGELVHTEEYEFTVAGVYVPMELVETDASRAVYVPNNTIRRINDIQTRLMDEYDCEVFTDKWLNSKSPVCEGETDNNTNFFSKVTYVSNALVQLNNPDDYPEIKKEIESVFPKEGMLEVVTLNNELSDDEVYSRLSNTKDMIRQMYVLVEIVLLTIMVIGFIWMIQADSRKEKSYFNIGDNIKNARIEAGMTQQDLADVIGVSRQAISIYENNKGGVPSDLVESIAKILSIEIEQLTNNEESEKHDALFAMVILMFAYVFISILIPLDYSVNRKSGINGLIFELVKLLVLPLMAFYAGIKARKLISNSFSVNKGIRGLCFILTVLLIVLNLIRFHQLVFNSAVTKFVKAYLTAFTLNPLNGLIFMGLGVATGKE